MSGISDNARALLGMISDAEGTGGDDGYSIMFGGKRFDGFANHPGAIQRSGGYASDAAGKYQFLSTTWDGVAKELGLKDFSPESQDLAALQLVRRRGVDPDAPLTKEALAKLAPEWASLPTLEGKSYYGQPVKSHQELFDIYAGRRGASGGATGGSSPTLATPEEVKPLEVKPLQVIGAPDSGTIALQPDAASASTPSPGGRAPGGRAPGGRSGRSSLAAMATESMLQSVINSADNLPAPAFNPQGASHPGGRHPGGKAPGGLAPGGLASGSRMAGSRIRAVRNSLLDWIGSAGQD